MQIQSLAHIAIHVADLKVSIPFYRDIMGFQQIPRPSFDFPGAWFRIGTDDELHLIGNRTQPVYSDSRGVHFALYVHDIKGIEAELTAKKATFKGSKLRADGSLHLFVYDPDGYCIELCEIKSTTPS